MYIQGYQTQLHLTCGAYVHTRSYEGRLVKVCYSDVGILTCVYFPPPSSEKLLAVWDFPLRSHLTVRSPSTPTGPRACILPVDIPTSAPSPKRKPSANLDNGVWSEYNKIAVKTLKSRAAQRMMNEGKTTASRRCGTRKQSRQIAGRSQLL